MKTAEDIINNHLKEWNESHPTDKVKFGQALIDEVVKIMKKYAEQAIDQCAEDARSGDYDTGYRVDEQSILAVKEQLK